MASPFLAPRIVSALTDLPGIFRRVQEALDRVSRSGYVLGLATRDLTPVCPSFQRVSTPAGGVRCVLPRADETNAGQSIILNLENPLGNLTIFPAPGQAVNGATTAVYTVGGVIELFSNGVDGWFGLSQLPAGGAGTPTWAQVLASGNVTAGVDPTISSGDALAFAVGATGITAAGDLTAACVGAFEVTSTDMHLHPTGALHVGHEGTTASIHQGCVGTWEGVCADFSLQASSTIGASAGSSITLSTAASNRVVIDNAGAVNIVGTNYLLCGAAGPATGQIRSGDAVFQVHGSAQVNVVGDTATLISGNSGNTIASLDNTGFKVLTASSARLTIAGTGQWTLGAVAGSSGQFIRHQGAANPTWASLALSDLPSQAADSFLGRLAGSGTPTAQLFSDIDSASLVYDAVSHTFQVAAGTGDVTWSQNSTATTIAANAVSNTKLRDSGALSVIGRSANSSGDPADISATAASGAVLRESGSTLGFGQIATAGITNNAVDDTKIRQGGACSVIGRSANSAGNVADISATINDRILSRVSNVVGFNQLSNAMIPSTTITKDKLIQSGDQTVLGNGSGASASPADLTLVEPLVATVNSLTIQASSRMGMIKEDVDALGSLSLGYRKSRKTHWFHDDFDYLSGTGAVTTTGLVLGTGTGNWFCQAVGASGSIAMQTAENNHPGILRMTTGATNGNTMRICKGSVSTTTWIRGDEVEILEVVARAPSTASVGFYIGMTDLANNQLAFSFDTATDTTVHVLCTEGGVTTDTDTNVAPGTDWDVYMIRQTTAGTVEFLIDDVVVATVATNIPDTETLNLDIEVFTRTAAGKSFDIDYVYFQSRDLGVRTA